MKNCKTFHHPEWESSSKPLVSTVKVEAGPGHDHVHVWNRGGKAGVLTVNSGDGAALAHHLVKAPSS